MNFLVVLIDTFLGGKIGADAVNPSDAGKYGGPESGTSAEGAFYKLKTILVMVFLIYISSIGCFIFLSCKNSLSFSVKLSIPCLHILSKISSLSRKVSLYL